MSGGILVDSLWEPENRLFSLVPFNVIARDVELVCAPVSVLCMN